MGTGPTGAANDPTLSRRQPIGADVERPLLSWQKAAVAILVGLVVVLGGGTLLVRQLITPANSQLGVVPQTIVTPRPTAPPAATVPAPTLAPAVLQPVATEVPTATAVVEPTTAPTPVPVSQAQAPTPAPTSQDEAPTEPPPTAEPAAENPSAAIDPTLLPTVDPELRQEVEHAYLQYWDARAQAAWTLDPTPLDAVATGDELSALERDLAQLQSDGRAVKGEVQHQYTVVRVGGDEAQVLDRVRDFSIYVDPSTKEPLPGQVRPDDADAPTSTILFFLQRDDDGTWKVARGERHADS
jgi:hypothetical protein